MHTRLHGLESLTGKKSEKWTLLRRQDRQAQGTARPVYQGVTCLRVTDSFYPLYFVVPPQTAMISPFPYLWFLP